MYRGNLLPPVIFSRDGENMNFFFPSSTEKSKSTLKIHKL